MQISSLQYFHRIILVVVLIASIESCEIINPDERVPAYISCDSISFKATNSSQGSSSSSITDMWVYLDDAILGTFELPAEIPAIAEGNHKITVKPGIMVNGISASRGIYPHYTSYDTTINFEKEKTYKVHPSSTYSSFAQFMLMEDFEQSGLIFSRSPISDTTLNFISSGDAFEGRSGVIYLDTARSDCEYYSTLPFQANQGNIVYCELNYKCSQDFLIGLYAIVGSQQAREGILNIRSSSTWNKIYVNLTDIMSLYPTASGFRLFIYASLPSSKLNSTIYLDNIKVIK